MTKPYVLSGTQEAFAEELVASGRYGSVEDVIHDALRLLREQEPVTVSSLQDLQRAWREGVESGDYKSADDVSDRLETKNRAMDEGQNA